MLERLQDEEAKYRVTIVKTFPTLEAARELFLSEIPEKQLDYHAGIIEDYTKKRHKKTDQEAPRPQPKLQPKKGRQNAKSK